MPDWSETRFATSTHVGSTTTDEEPRLFKATGMTWRLVGTPAIETTALPSRGAVPALRDPPPPWAFDPCADRTRGLLYEIVRGEFPGAPGELWTLCSDYYADWWCATNLEPPAATVLLHQVRAAARDQRLPPEHGPRLLGVLGLVGAPPRLTRRGLPAVGTAHATQFTRAGNAMRKALSEMGPFGDPRYAVPVEHCAHWFATWWVRRYGLQEVVPEQGSLDSAVRLFYP